MNEHFTEIGLTRLIKYLAFGLWELIFHLLPYSPLRVLWLKIGGAQIAWSAIIDRVNFFNLDRIGLSGLKIGRDCFIGCQTTIDLAGKVILEDQATLANNVVILSHISVGFKDHPLIKKYPKKISTTTIKSGSFIGANATILPGITIGKNSMIAAGSVVTKNIPSKSLAAGNPATIKKKI
jgi:acetyltransferase-like isoleucine patch superfamily enzyme